MKYYVVIEDANPQASAENYTAEHYANLIKDNTAAKTAYIKLDMLKSLEDAKQIANDQSADSNNAFVVFQVEASGKAVNAGKGQKGKLSAFRTTFLSAAHVAQAEAKQLSADSLQMGNVSDSSEQLVPDVSQEELARLIAEQDEIEPDAQEQAQIEAYLADQALEDAAALAQFEAYQADLALAEKDAAEKDAAEKAAADKAAAEKAAAEKPAADKAAAEKAVASKVTARRSRLAKLAVASLALGLGGAAVAYAGILPGMTLAAQFAAGAAMTAGAYVAAKIGAPIVKATGRAVMNIASFVAKPFFAVAKAGLSAAKATGRVSMKIAEQAQAKAYLAKQALAEEAAMRALLEANQAEQAEAEAKPAAAKPAATKRSRLAKIAIASLVLGLGGAAVAYAGVLPGMTLAAQFAAGAAMTAGAFVAAKLAKPVIAVAKVGFSVAKAAGRAMMKIMSAVAKPVVAVAKAGFTRTKSAASFAGRKIGSSAKAGFSGIKSAASFAGRVIRSSAKVVLSVAKRAANAAITAVKVTAKVAYSAMSGTVGLAAKVVALPFRAVAAGFTALKDRFAKKNDSDTKNGVSVSSPVKEDAVAEAALAATRRTHTPAQGGYNMATPASNDSAEKDQLDARSKARFAQ